MDTLNPNTGDAQNTYIDLIADIDKRLAVGHQAKLLQEVTSLPGLIVQRLQSGSEEYELARAVTNLLPSVFYEIFNNMESLIKDSEQYVQAERRVEFLHKARSSIMELRDSFRKFLLSEPSRILGSTVGGLHPNARSLLREMEKSIRRYDVLFPHNSEEFELSLRYWAGGMAGSATHTESERESALRFSGNSWIDPASGAANTGENIY